MEAMEQGHQGSTINVTGKGPFVISEFEKAPGPADGEFTSFVRAVFEMRLRAKQPNLWGRIVVSHSFDVMHLTLITDALKSHDSPMITLTVISDALETDGLGEFVDELKISFVSRGGD